MVMTIGGCLLASVTSGISRVFRLSNGCSLARWRMSEICLGFCLAGSDYRRRSHRRARQRGDAGGRRVALHGRAAAVRPHGRDGDAARRSGREHGIARRREGCSPRGGGRSLGGGRGGDTGMAVQEGGFPAEGPCRRGAECPGGSAGHSPRPGGTGDPGPGPDHRKRPTDRCRHRGAYRRRRPLRRQRVRSDDPRHPERRRPGCRPRRVRWAGAGAAGRGRRPGGGAGAPPRPGRTRSPARSFSRTDAAGDRVPRSHHAGPGGRPSRRPARGRDEGPRRIPCWATPCRRRRAAAIGRGRHRARTGRGRRPLRPSSGRAVEQGQGENALRLRR